MIDRSIQILSIERRCQIKVYIRDKKRKERRKERKNRLTQRMPNDVDGAILVCTRHVVAVAWCHWSTQTHSYVVVSSTITK